MLKIIGAFLLIAAGAGIGFRRSEKLRVRHKKLMGFTLLLEEVSGGIRRGFSLEEIWRQVDHFKLISTDGYTAAPIEEGLNKDDVGLIREFFCALGMSDAESSIKRCENYRDLILKRAADAEQEVLQKARLYGLLGVFFGIFGAIIFS